MSVFLSVYVYTRARKRILDDNPTTNKASFTHLYPLQWRHNDHGGVSNHQPHGCLLNRLFRHRSKKTSKLRVTGLCVGNSPGPVNSPHKGPVTRKMFPFDDTIMKLDNRLVYHNQWKDPVWKKGDQTSRQEFMFWSVKIFYSKMSMIKSIIAKIWKYSLNRGMFPRGILTEGKPTRRDG